MKKLIVIIQFLVVSFSFGAVTLVVDQGGFENESGVATDGMEFGWVVDTNGDGFTPGNYLAFDISFNGQFLEDAFSGVTDDWFVYGGAQGSLQSPPITQSVFPYGSGSITSNSDVGLATFSGSLDNTMEFAVIWFPSGTASTGGAVYGFAVDTGSTLNMIIPSDTFANDPPDSISTKTPSYTIAVPEPAHFALLFGLFGLGVVVWRRRR